jgi:hypothetical protein
MVTFNEKDGKGNEPWQKALAEVTAGKEFTETREAVLKMMAEAKDLHQSSSRQKQTAPKKKSK